MGMMVRPVPAGEYGVMAAAPGHRSRVAVAYRAEQIPPWAAATWRPRVSGSG